MTTSPVALSRRYLAVLAVVACLILVVGVFVRERLGRHAGSASAAPPSEATALQQLSQQGQFRRMSAHVASRAATAAAFVTYLPGLGASGVRWRGDTVLSTSATRAVVAVRASGADTLRPSASPSPDSVRRDWVLVVARRTDDEPLSTLGLLGGRAARRCADRAVEEYVVGVALPDAFAGAGVFDLDGQALGMVVRCGDRLAALPMREVARLLVDTVPAVPSVRDGYGLAVAPVDSAVRAYFGVDSGVLVTAVRRGGRADAAGLRAGDVILTVDGRTVSTAADLVSETAAVDSAGSRTVVRRRGRAVATVRLTRPDSETGATETGGVGLRLGSPPAPRGVADRGGAGRVACCHRGAPGRGPPAPGRADGGRLRRGGRAPVRRRGRVADLPRLRPRLGRARGVARGAAVSAGRARPALRTAP